MDSNRDGLVDLRELATALSKWLALVAYPGTRDLLHPYATGRDIALDFFIAMKQDPRRSASFHLRAHDQRPLHHHSGAVPSVSSVASLGCYYRALYASSKKHLNHPSPPAVEIYFYTREKAIFAHSRVIPRVSLCRGLGPAGLQSVLQALCLTARSSFDVIEDWVEATLLLPDPRLSEAVRPFDTRHQSAFPASLLTAALQRTFRAGLACRALHQ